MGDDRKREKRSFPPFSVSHCPLRAFLSRLLGFPVKQRALNISMGKPRITFGKSNGARHSVWEDTENMNCYLKRYIFSGLFSLFSWFGYSLWRRSVPQSQIWSFNVYQERFSLDVYAQDSQPGGLHKWHPKVSLWRVEENEITSWCPEKASI